MPFLCSVPPNIFFSIYSPTSSPSSLSSTLVLHRSRNAEITDCCVIRRGALTPLCRSMELSSFLPFSSLALDASTSVDPDCLTTSVRPLQQSTSLSQWNLGPRHIFLLNIITCTVAISASMLFFSAIPTLLAFKRAAESLEKLMDVTAEELPGTMAAMRLCGMEISDLTMELSDIGQEITQGVKSSTRAIHVAEERLRSLATMNPMVSTQVLNSSKQVETLPLANKARNLRIGIVKGRKLLGIVSSVSQFSKWFSKIFMSGNQRRWGSKQAR